MPDETSPYVINGRRAARAQLARLGGVSVVYENGDDDNKTVLALIDNDPELWPDGGRVVNMVQRPYVALLLTEEVGAPPKGAVIRKGDRGWELVDEVENDGFIATFALREV